MFFRAIEILLSIFTFLGGLQTIIWFLELISPVKISTFKYKFTKKWNVLLKKNEKLEINAYKSFCCENNFSFDEFINLFKNKKKFFFEEKVSYLRMSFLKNGMQINVNVNKTINSDDSTNLNVHINSEFEFKNFKKNINEYLWILNEISHLNNIIHNSDNIEVVYTSNMFKYFSNITNELGNIIAKNVSISRDDDVISLKYNIPLDTESIDFIYDSILLAMS